MTAVPPKSASTRGTESNVSGGAANTSRARPASKTATPLPTSERKDTASPNASFISRMYAAGVTTKRYVCQSAGLRGPGGNMRSRLAGIHLGAAAGRAREPPRATTARRRASSAVGRSERRSPAARRCGHGHLLRSRCDDLPRPQSTALSKGRRGNARPGGEARRVAPERIREARRVPLAGRRLHRAVLRSERPAATVLDDARDEAVTALGCPWGRATLRRWGSGRGRRERGAPPWRHRAPVAWRRSGACPPGSHRS